MDLGHTIKELFGRNRRTSAPDPIELGADALYDLLADSRRRRAIELLADRGATTVADLAVEVAAAETHTTEEFVPRRRIEPVEVDLRDEQLPRLADAGVVRWGAQDDVVRPGHSVEAIVALFRDVDRRTSDRRREEGFPFAVGSTSLDRGTNQRPPSRGGHHP